MGALKYVKILIPKPWHKITQPLWNSYSKDKTGKLYRDVQGPRRTFIQQVFIQSLLRTLDMESEDLQANSDSITH
jgi:hypothetical protein